MKCCHTLKAGGSCGAMATFDYMGNPLCRRHASEKIFVQVLQSPSLSAQVGLSKVET